MKIIALIFFMNCVIGFAQEEDLPLSNGLGDNVVTSLDSCTWVSVSLPEQLTDIHLNNLHLPCNNLSCKATVNESIEVKYSQIHDGRSYEVQAQICKPEEYFRIGWQVEKFDRSGRTTILTQFIVPENNWSVNNISCIQPQYSLPLIRTINESSQTIVTCAIRKSLCNTDESVTIFDLNGVFCSYNKTVKTCGKTNGENGTVTYTTTVYNTAPNKYFPDQYIFCNTLGSYMSIKITWNTAQQPTTTEKLATTLDNEHQSTIIVETETTTLLNYEDPCSCPDTSEASEVSSCKSTATVDCPASCRK
ncbi:hypothetical protein SprV_0802516300 [Sparganum proliferum]